MTGDFTCRGKAKYAILGTNQTDIVVAIFIDVPKRRPRILEHSAKVRDAAAAKLHVENPDFYPKEALGYELPGFQRSKTCSGLQMTDERIDSAHIYWNRRMHQFDDWSL